MQTTEQIESFALSLTAVAEVLKRNASGQVTHGRAMEDQPKSELRKSVSQCYVFNNAPGLAIE